MRYTFKHPENSEPFEILLPQTLRMLRLHNELKQHEIAKILNIDRSTYTYYETGKAQPSLSTLVCLARMYGVSVDFLLGNAKKTAAELKAAVFISIQADTTRLPFPDTQSPPNE